MSKIFKIFSQNKKFLILLGLGLILIFLPLKFVNSQVNNHNPPQAFDKSVTTFLNTPVSIYLDAFDPDGDPLTYSIVTLPSNGTLSETPPNVTYVPNTDYTGSDSFTFKANDGTQDSNIATVTITVSSSVTTEFCPGCGPAPWQWPICIVCFVQYLISLPIRLPFFILALVLGLIALVSGVIFSVIISLLTWLKTIVLTVPITHGGLVDVGWTFTRDFANMFFILILVFIGLATILRLKDYEAKKALPKLIFVALLINFTPVIVGFVVDAANIFTNFFLTKAGEFTSLADLFNKAVNYITTSFWTIFTVDGLFFQHLLTDYNGNPAILGVLIGIIVYGLVLIAFYGLATLVYLVVIVLLFARILFLWILMILAPIAFFSQVLPPSKTVKALFPSILHWDEWWEKLIQWSILGIPLGFFLYLSNWVMKNQDAMNTVLKPGGLNIGNITEGGVTIALAAGAGILTSILIPLTSLVLLGFGAMVSIQAAPAGAKAILDYAKKGGMAVTTLGPVRAGLSRLAGGTAGALSGAVAGAQRLEAFVGKVPILGKPLKYGVAKPISWTTRGMEMAAAPALIKYAAEMRKLAPKDIDDIDKMAPADAEAFIRAKGPLLTGDQRGQYQARMAEEENLEFTSPGFQKEAKDWRKKILTEENPYFQKEASSLRKALGDVSEEEKIHMKQFGIKDPTKRKEAEDEVKKEVAETRDIIEKRIGQDEFTIEAALKLKYITKEDIDKNRVAALATAKAKVTAKELGDIAAAATDVKELKPEDIKKIINPDNFATRVGITLGNSRNLQKIQDNFGRKKFEAIIKGRGGLNDAMSSPKKLREFHKINPQLAKAVFTSPVYREMEIEGRNQMLDPNDQPTTSFAAHEKRMKIQDILEKDSILKRFNKLQIDMRKNDRMINKNKIEGKPTTHWENLLANNMQKANQLWKSRIAKNFKRREKLKEIQRLKKSPKKGP